MIILNLFLKARWYNMIESGVKTEEYREIKSHWLKRLLKVIDLDHTHYESLDDECVDFYMNNVDLMKEDWRLGGFQQMGYTHVKFFYGYTRRTMTFEIESIAIGKGNPEWGAPPKDVFIIKLGKRIE